jgi:hypothetical protein
MLDWASSIQFNSIQQDPLTKQCMQGVDEVLKRCKEYEECFFAFSFHQNLMEGFGLVDKGSNCGLLKSSQDNQLTDSLT